MHLTTNELQVLRRLKDGEHHPGLATFNLIFEGYATYRRAWFLFGPKVVRLTRKGKAAIKEPQP